MIVTRRPQKILLSLLLVSKVLGFDLIIPKLDEINRQGEREKSFKSDNICRLVCYKHTRKEGLPTLLASFKASKRPLFGSFLSSRMWTKERH